MTKALALFLVSSVAASAQERAPEPFEKLHRMVRSDPAEAPWAEIDWMTSVWQARERAAREGKPLLLWAAGGGGHPLALC
jgi:hypothetical protein